MEVAARQVITEEPHVASDASVEAAANVLVLDADSTSAGQEKVSWYVLRSFCPTQCISVHVKYFRSNFFRDHSLQEMVEALS